MQINQVARATIFQSRKGGRGIKIRRLATAGGVKRKTKLCSDSNRGPIDPRAAMGPPARQMSMASVNAENTTTTDKTSSVHRTMLHRLNKRTANSAYTILAAAVTGNASNMPRLS